ncbi:MAG: nucleotidyltransferase domain-containing protein [Chloroflexi bacterium]|nr:nucleotidyltransferase domain-containing protein [Chloroflexota bacterium]
MPVLTCLSEERKKLLEAELARYLEVLPRLQDVKKVILFGSLATGRVGPASDIDLLIVQQTTTRFLDRPDHFIQELDIRVATDLFIYTPQELEQMVRESSFVRQAIREGRVVYEARAQG